MPITRTELKNLSALSTRRGRRDQGRFLAEGVRLLEESIRHRVRPQAVYFAPHLLSERGRHLLDRFRRQHTPCEQLPARQFEKLADTRTPQGILGLFPEPTTNLKKLYSPRIRTILVCDRIADPGNLGTLLRSALAFGFELVVLVGNSAEPFAPKVVRASVGAVFGLHIARADYQALGDLASETGFAVVAATAGAGDPDWRRALGRHKRLFLAVGSEAEGLSPEVEALAAVRAHIAHSDRVESLNAAVAASILMKEVYDLTR